MPPVFWKIPFGFLKGWLRGAGVSVPFDRSSMPKRKPARTLIRTSLVGSHVVQMGM